MNLETSLSEDSLNRLHCNAGDVDHSISTEDTNHFMLGSVQQVFLSERAFVNNSQVVGRNSLFEFSGENSTNIVNVTLPQVISQTGPLFSSLPHLPNYFIETQYKTILNGKIAEQLASIKRLAIYGTAGSGKTMLAQSYVRDYQKRHVDHYIFIVVSETLEGWWSSLREKLYPKIGHLLLAETNQEKQQQMIINHLKYELNQKPWCILLDNWDEAGGLTYKAIEDLFNIGTGILLVTTQHRSPYSQKNCSLNLSNGFTREESNLLLNKILIPLENKQEILGSEQELGDLIQVLNGLPLALVQAGSYLLWENLERQERGQLNLFTYTNYQTLLQEKIDYLIQQHHVLLAQEGRADIPREPHSPHLAFRQLKTQEAAVNLSIQKAIQPESNHVNLYLWQVLCFCSFLASDNIPQALLRDYLHQQFSEKITSEINDILNNALKAAQRYSLLQFEEKHSVVDKLFSLHIHRVIQRVLIERYWQDLLEKEDKQKIVRSQIFAFRNVFQLATQNEMVLITQAYQPHVKSYLRYEASINCFELNFLKKDLSCAYKTLSDYQMSKLLCIDALQTIQKIYPNEEIEILKTERELAVSLERLGEYNEAEKKYKELLEKICGENTSPQEFNLIIACIKADYSLVLHRFNKNEEAEALANQALSTMMAYYKDEAYKEKEVIWVFQTLSCILNGLDRFVEAKNYCDLALRNMQQYHEQSIILIAKIKVDLSVSLEKLGEYEEARKYLEESLEVMEEHYNYPNQCYEILVTRGNLAEVLEKLGAHEAAAGVYPGVLEALEIYYQERLPHIHVAVVQRDFAINLNSLKRYNEALGFLKKSLLTMISFYQEINSEISITVDTLKESLSKIGMYQEFRSLEEIIFAQKLDMIIQFLLDLDVDLLLTSPAITLESTVEICKLSSNAFSENRVTFFTYDTCTISNIVQISDNENLNEEVSRIQDRNCCVIM